MDPPREIAGASERQLRTLQVFGLESDVAVVRQSALGDRYRAVLDRLLASGQAFVCHCSRSDLAADARVHRRCTSGACRNDPAIRFRVPSRTTVRFDDLLQGSVEQQIDTAVGDFVLRRTDGLWAYQLAVVVDDAAQGITDVVRGADLLDSTPRQILLQRAIGVPTPRYAHLPLVVDAAGHKLSKSTAAIPVDDDAPLPALQAAWSVLGQTAGALAGATSVSTLLNAAIRDFHPAGVPRGPVATPA